MDFIPSHYEIQMQKFFLNRKIAINRLKELGFEMPYLSEKLTYDQLLLEYIAKDFSNNEISYLKAGIETFFNCLKKVNEQVAMSSDLAYNIVYNKHKDYADRFLNTKDHDNITKWLYSKVEFEINSDLERKKITEEVLTREISEFKIRLGRVNVNVDIKGGNLNFDENKKSEKLIISSKEIIENPFPDIFIDVNAYTLFCRLHDIFKNTESPLADYSFIYRQMSEKDKLIKDTFRPEKFRDWVNSEPFCVNVDSKLKTYEKCFTKLKYNFYEFVKKVNDIVP